MTGIPEGYKPHFRSSKFTDPWEPLYSSVTPQQISLGTILRDVHCNSRGLVHGGFIASLSDNAMGLSRAQALKSDGRDFKGLVTINLSTDFVGLAKVGQWIATHSHVIKIGGSLAFVSSEMRTTEDVISRANATFKTV